MRGGLLGLGRFDERSEKRDPFSVSMQFVYTFRNGEHRRARAEGLTTDISDGGLGLYTDRPLKRGQVVKVYSSEMDEAPLRAEVRWCTKYSESLYRVGARLL
ncbi:MAG: PilZ domain-containing protein [Nitrospirota bacterium]